MQKKRIIFTSQKHPLGYTFIEMLVVITLMLWIGATAIHGWKYIINGIEKQIFINNIHRALVFAREIAIHHHQLVTLCGSSSGKDCDGRWQNGQIILSITSKKLWYRFQNTSSRFYLRWIGNGLAKSDLIFTPLGFTRGQQGSIVIYSNQTQLPVAKLIITRSGRIREANDNDMN